MSEYYSGMNHLDPGLLDLLREVAEEMIEATEADGHLVTKALAQHDAFSLSGAPRSSLRRALIAQAAQRRASQVGLHTERKSMDSIEITHLDGLVETLVRLKSVKVNAQGESVAVCGADSTLLKVDGEKLAVEEKWILGYTVTDLDTIADIFVAKIRGFIDGKPVKLILGPPISLRRTTPTPGGFVSRDEELPGFETHTDEGTDDGLGDLG